MKTAQKSLKAKFLETMAFSVINPQGLDYKLIFQATIYTLLEIATFYIWGNYPIIGARNFFDFFVLTSLNIFLDVVKERLSDLMRDRISINFIDNFLSMFKQIGEVQGKETEAKKILGDLMRHSDLWPYQSLVILKGAFAVVTGGYAVCRAFYTESWRAVVWIGGVLAAQFAFASKLQKPYGETRDLSVKILNVLRDKGEVNQIKDLNKQYLSANNRVNNVRVGMYMPTFAFQLMSLPATGKHLEKIFPSYSSFLPVLPVNFTAVSRFINWYIGNYTRLSEWNKRIHQMGDLFTQLEVLGIKVRKGKSNIAFPYNPRKYISELIAEPWHGLPSATDRFFRSMLPYAAKLTVYRDGKFQPSIVLYTAMAAASEISSYYLWQSLKNMKENQSNIFGESSLMLFATSLLQEYFYGKVQSNSLLNIRENALKKYKEEKDKLALLIVLENADPLSTQGSIVAKGIFSSFGPLLDSGVQYMSHGNLWMGSYICGMLSANMIGAIYYSRYFFEAKRFVRDTQITSLMQTVESEADREKLINDSFVASLYAYIKLGNSRMPLNMFSSLSNVLDTQRGIEPLNRLVQTHGVELGLGQNPLAGFRAFNNFVVFFMQNYFRVTDAVEKLNNVANNAMILDGINETGPREIPTVGNDYLKNAYCAAAVSAVSAFMPPTIPVIALGVGSSCLAAFYISKKFTKDTGAMAR